MSKCTLAGRAAARRHAARSGFTLIEMMVVIVIIGILIGLLVPVIAGAFRRGKEAAEIAEIQNLVGALQRFKDRYGAYPPSQIILREDGAYTFGAAPFVGPGNQSTAVFDETLSIQYINRFWPQMRIHTDGTAVTPAEIGDINGDGTIDVNDFYDWNGDGVKNGPWYLQGDECLVFFLGGIPTGQYTDSGGTVQRPGSVGFDPKKYPPGALGFGKTPQWPTQPVVPSAGRDGPFYELPGERLQDRDGDGFYELTPYRNPGTAAYAYFSSYDGTGYRPDDLNLATEPSGVPVISADFGVLWPLNAAYPSPPRSAGAPYYLQSPGPNPYTIGTSLSAAAGWVVRYWKPDAFQIISPGTNRGYGSGGEFPLPSDASDEDKDNLANFSPAELSSGKQ